MTIQEALDAEIVAFDAITRRLNEGVAPMDPKVPILRLVQAYGIAARRRQAVEIRDAVQQWIP